jgi:hypothetical protein
MGVSHFLINDVLQMYGHNGATGCLKAHKDGLEGKVYLLHGSIVHAQCRALMGEKACSIILSWNEVPTDWIENERPAFHTMKEDVQGILLKQAFVPVRSLEEQAMLLTFGDPDIDLNIVDQNTDDTIYGFIVTGRNFEPYRIELDQDEVIVGRTPEFCHAVVPDASVSSKHGIFTRIPPFIHFKDLGSTNGSRVNSQLVTACELRPGQRICLGKAVLDLYAIDAKAIETGENLTEAMKAEVAQILSFPLLELGDPEKGLIEPITSTRKRSTTRLDLSKLDLPPFRGGQEDAASASIS